MSSIAQIPWYGWALATWFASLSVVCLLGWRAWKKFQKLFPLTPEQVTHIHECLTLEQRVQFEEFARGLMRSWTSDEQIRVVRAFEQRAPQPAGGYGAIPDAGLLALVSRLGPAERVDLLDSLSPFDRNRLAVVAGQVLAAVTARADSDQELAKAVQAMRSDTDETLPHSSHPPVQR